MPLGVSIDGTLAVSDVCADGACGPASSIDLAPQTPFEPVPVVAWEQSGARWVLPGRGSFVSARYPDGTTCVYLHTERWDVRVVDAAPDGDRLVATRLEGTFERADVLDVGRSIGDVDGFCPPYEARDLWSVLATADVGTPPATSPTTEPAAPTAAVEPEPPPAASTEPAVARADGGGGRTALVVRRGRRARPAARGERGAGVDG